MTLKIDVDTYEGMNKGVPALLEDLEHFGVKGTFCLSFGPDNSGKAIFRLFKDKKFLKKMLSTGAPRLYGLRTILSGTLLPARKIAVSFPGLSRRIKEKGHEVIVHAWDHRKWQDRIKSMGEDEIKGEFQSSFSAYEKIFGKRPHAVAAPGWQVSEKSLKVQDSLGLLYQSDLREGEPCFLKIRYKVLRTLQIPTTGPCVEELLASGVRDEYEMEKRLLEGLKGAKYPVLALHAEVEGGIYRPFFRRLMKRLLEEYSEFITLKEVAERLLESKKEIPVLEFKEIELPGRAGLVASSNSYF